MATTKRNTRNNNPEGHNQYSNGWMDSARERPFSAAAAVGGAVAAGVFLWSRRNQISDEIGRLGEQIGEWRDSMQSNDGMQRLDEGRTSPFIAKPAKARRGQSMKSQAEIAEEALSLKASGSTASHPADPVIEDQLKVGAVAY